MTYPAKDYVIKPGKSRFREWHARLTGKAAAIIDVAVRKLEFGNFKSAKNIKNGVYVRKPVIVATHSSRRLQKPNSRK